MPSRITADLNGQTALVTGAARGLGRSIAQSLAAAGAKIACIDVNVEVLADAVAAILRRRRRGRAVRLRRYAKRSGRRGGR